MRKRKRGRMRRAAASFLSAMLVAGMLSNASPADVRAEENGESVESVETQENEAEATGSETVTKPDGENVTVPVVKPAEGEGTQNLGGGTVTEPGGKAETEGPDETVTEGPDGVIVPETGTGVVAPETVLGNGLERDAAAAPVRVRAAAEPAEQADLPVSGTDWTLDTDGRLTIISDGGMTDWTANGVRDNKSALVSAEISSGVTTIKQGSFQNCHNLKNITIAGSVTEIQMSAFWDASGLEEVTMLGNTPPTLGMSAFESCNRLQSIHVPAGSKAAYQEKWADMAAYITDGTHEHSWSSDWTTSETHHWHACTAADCPIQNDAEKGQYGAHAYDDASSTKCNICGYIRTVAATEITEITVQGDLTYDRAAKVGDNITCPSMTITLHPEAEWTAQYQWWKGGDSGFTEIGAGQKWEAGVYVMKIPVKLTSDADNCIFADALQITSPTGENWTVVERSDDKRTIVLQSDEIVKTAAHTHSWSSDWTTNETHHWHECSAADCTVQNNTDKNGYEAHVENEGEVTTAPTQTTDGVKTYRCTVCAKELRTETIPALGESHTHAYTVCKYDENEHWYECVCGERDAASSEAHTPGTRREPGTEATCTQEGTRIVITFCTECNMEIARTTETVPQMNHSRDGGTVTKQPTATEPGIRTYKCRMCGTAMGTETIPATGSGGNSGSDGDNGGSGDHDGGGNSGSSGSSGSSNNDGSGSNSDNGAGGDNSGGGTTDGTQGGSDSSGGNSGAGNTSISAPAPAGTGQPRVKQEKEGSIRKEVSVTGENTLDASVATPLSELAGLVLTEAERKQASGGTDVRIVLDMKDISGSVSSADKALVEAALNSSAAQGYTLGQYLDINLFKVVGESRSAVKETTGKITVTISVPDSLKNTDGTKTRVFAVIRVHGGKAEFLSDLDNNDDTITIATDRFSTYAVVYKDVAAGNGVMNLSADGGSVTVNARSGSSGNAGGKKENEPKTGDDTPVELWATLSMVAGVTYLFLYFIDRRYGMTEETKQELVFAITEWAKQGGRVRRLLAIAAIFGLLVYYHSIGKKTCVEWEEWTA